MFFKLTFPMDCTPYYFTGIFANKPHIIAWYVIIILVVVSVTGCNPYEPKAPLVVVRKPGDIILIDSTVVPPVYYHNEYDFRKQQVAAKKRDFIQMLLPPILMAKHNFKQDRIRAGLILYNIKQDVAPSQEDSVFMNTQMERLNAGSWTDLYDRLATHPTSIVLAQAAVESGWGSSRFFRQGNNLFGIWSFNPDDDRIEAANAREEGSVFVRSYKTIAESVEDYFVTLARHNAYKAFREKRLNERDPRKLIYELHRYSELGYQYVNKLGVVIKQNKLEQFDTFHLDSAYVKRDELVYF
jgi:Bax protein